MQSAKRLHQPYQDSKYRAGKTTARPKRTTPTTSSTTTRRQTPKPASPPEGTTPSPFVVTLIVGRDDQRLFAAHETVLAASPFFAKCCRSQPRFEPKRISLPDEQPEVLSCVLEYLYRGDYSPYLVHDPAKGTWRLQCGGGDRTGATRVTGIEAEGQNHGATIFHESAGAVILRDTAIYCAAEKYSLEPLKHLALRKQGLHRGIQCGTILASARFAYANTPDTESILRAHYLALIVRSRSTFKRSGTMQMEMEKGGKFFFDLFVALCNFMDDESPTPVEDFEVGVRGGG